MRATAADRNDPLAALMERVVRASAGPFMVVQTASRRHTVTAGPGGRMVASFTRAADAQLFVRSVPALRELVGAVSEVLGYHLDDGTGRCAECATPYRCRTRRTLDDLAALAATG
jgi:hypothetical protein